MVNSKATLVIIPFGSTNVLASELGIPDDPVKAAELITKGKKIKMAEDSCQTPGGFNRIFCNPGKY